MSGRRLRLRPALAAALFLVAVAGCGDADGEKGRPMPRDLEEARASLRAAFDDTRRLLAPAVFTQDDPEEIDSRGPCDLPGGGEGESVLPPPLIADPTGEPRELIAKVAARWRAKGYTVQERSFSEMLEVAATTTDGGAIIFGIGERAQGRMTLHGETACVPKRS
jgi:hypothetical protein